MRKYEVTIFRKIKNDSHLSVPERRAGETLGGISLGELTALSVKHSWSPGIFNNKSPSSASFLWADVIALDFDGRYSFQEAINELESLEVNYSITPTRNHLKPKNGVTEERFRVVLPLQNRVTSTQKYSQAVESLLEIFKKCDPCSKTGARIYFPSNGCTQTHSPQIVFSKKDLSLEFIGVSHNSALERFKSQAHSGLPGEFNNSLNVVAFDEGKKGMSFGKLRKEVEEYSPAPLDRSDLKTLQSGWDAGSKKDKYKANPESFILDLLEDKRFEMGMDGLFMLEGEAVKEDYVVDLVIRESQRRLAFSCPRDKITAILNVIVEETRKGMIDDLRKRIAFRSDVPCKLDQLSVAITGNNNSIDVAAIKSFFWQVKRKLCGLPVQHHLMPILVGKSGGGKSTVIEKLLSPFEGLIWYASIKELEDERSRYNLIDNYIFFGDELAKASRADMGAIKNAITSDTIQYRRMRQNKSGKGKNNCTFIGASNEEVIDTFKDPTSARRFYQINCSDELDWEFINEMIPLEIWQSVNENCEHSPLSEPEVGAGLKRRQEEIRYKDSVEQWLIDKDLKPGTGDKTRYDSIDSSYRKYKEYCEESGIDHCVQRNTFGRKLKSYLGTESKVVNGHRVQTFKRTTGKKESAPTSIFPFPEDLTVNTAKTAR